MRIRLLPLCIAAAALAAAACGSDDPVTVAEPAEAVAPVTGEPVDEMAGDETGTVVEPEIAGDATAARPEVPGPAMSRTCRWSMCTPARPSISRPW